MSNMYSDSVTRLRAPLVTDRYGNQTTDRDWPNAVQTQFRGVNVQPDNSVESVGERTSVTTAWRLVGPKGRDFDVLRTDRLVYDGMTLEVDGEVARYRYAGRVHHVEIRMVRVSG
ncbi:hypothetical protein [Streptomyces sp. ADI93-02]|uniref:hypothetical protein n=1 Tax=Streptomyces sp. ADI93-02 TaxID=1522757 RepID=UPI000F558BE4|nr:hypothetical protein [Streptomyces sp. ADI93-02]RPK50405.1 hypothetical protein EES40_05805 [Streptomyces sp. ADI93-02]